MLSKMIIESLRGQSTRTDIELRRFPEAITAGITYTKLRMANKTTALIPIAREIFAHERFLIPTPPFDVKVTGTRFPQLLESSSIRFRYIILAGNVSRKIYPVMQNDTLLLRNSAEYRQK